MFRHPQTCIAHSVNQWGMMIEIVELTDLMHERSRDIYKIQGEVQQEGNTLQYNSPGRGNFNPHGGYRGQGG
jgi:hypothetical protein